MRRGAGHTLRTRRLTLRPVNAHDADDIAAGVGNYDVARWLSAVPYPYGVEDAHRFIASSAAAPGGCWAICDAGGFCGLISTGEELGYWLDRRVWGLGYGTEAGVAVIDAWFRGTRRRDLEATYFEGNSRSARVLGKLGFVPEATQQRFARPLQQDVPTVVMRLTRQRWRAMRRFRVATPRLRLREVRPGDAAALARIGGDPRVAPMLGAVTSPWPVHAAAAWISERRYHGQPGFAAAICLRTGQVIGAVALGREGAVMIFVDPRYQGRGYGTEALHAFAADTLSRFDLGHLTADQFTCNTASDRLLAAAGFRPEGDGTSRSDAPLEPAPIVLYRLDAHQLRPTP